ncbi:hypothetical protein BV25DRAFT_1830590 [Artomyces pyxidatus]|uniref:Uncharacterized protein n=1 Tax=Artomyces pyxidatus TaxID=48021 RepID=A0ACB8SQB0_9AGAM|nr:hypothetical protein BV25DRAFT_1830590 [Artomyces pyxidatus]
MSSPPSALPPAVLKEVINGLHWAQGIRYLSAIGLVCLLYDHLLTLSDEIKFIWMAPRSWAKYVFLTNRYVVALCLLAAANGTSSLHRTVCQALLTTISVCAVFSISSANLMIYVRVLLLWEKNTRILLFLGTFFLLSSLATVGCMIASIIVFASTAQYSPLAGLCILTRHSKIFVAVWAAPMGFELSVLGMMLWHALSIPRTERIALSATLYRDGTMFFFAITCLRMINIAFAATGDPNRVDFPVFFVWALTTVIVNRLLIHIRSSEAKIEQEELITQMELDAEAEAENAQAYPYYSMRVDRVTTIEEGSITTETLEMRRLSE